MTGTTRVTGPIAFDTRTPNAARIYDYLLGGKDNFEADRQAAGALLRIAPDARDAAADNRKFLRDAIGYLAGEAGITQFLDIGSGLPSMGNVHEIALAANAGARVVYADYDPVVITHARERLADRRRVDAVLGDLRDPEGITGHGTVRELIDFARPVAVTLIAVLHFLNDREARAAVAHIRDLLVPGSFIAISHATTDGARTGEAEKITGLYERTSAPLHLRTREQIGDFFETDDLTEGMVLVRPGVVPAAAWRGIAPPRRVVCYAGVGKVR